MHRPFFYAAQSDTVVDIHIYGAIGWDNASYGDGTNNTAYSLVSLIKKLDKQYQRINVHINSPGGIIDEGLAIYNTLKNAKAEVHTYNSGLTASMASIILLAGTVHMPKTSIYHLHSASTKAWGNIKDFEAAIESLKVFESTLQQAIAEKTGMKVDEIQAKWFDGSEHYMTAEQANEYGFVDVIEETKATPPAAINQLENLSYAQLIELYKQEENPKTKNTILEKVKSIFTNSSINIKKEDMGKPLAFRAKLTILLALIGLQEFILNADGKVEMELDQAYKINDDLEANKAEIENLKQENIQLREQAEKLQQKNTELEAKIGNTSQRADSTISGDNTTINTNEQVVPLKPEVSKALHDYNRANGLYL